MKIEFIFDGEGNLCVLHPDGKIDFSYHEYEMNYEFMENLKDFLDKSIPRYKKDR